MSTSKDILVTTTSSIEGLQIKKYLKPISAHIVAGTNLFSDFIASFTDVFGGRSATYQKQLTSLYNEATERLKEVAYEMGANCILGLSIDMDEISGKGKSMFMLTAIGTAVILEKGIAEKISISKSGEKFENIGVDKIDTLRTKKRIIAKAEQGSLSLDDDTWSFITANQVDEVFPYLIKKFLEPLSYEQTSPESSNNFYKLLVGYLDALSENKKTELLYDSISKENNEQLVLRLSDAINELNLLNIDKCFNLLRNDDFKIQKRGLRILTFDKPFYNKQDLQDLRSIKKYIQETFIERGTRTTKKQLLSSKEKEVWTCECGKNNNEIGGHCNNCHKDIFGFKANETTSLMASNFIEEKIDLLSEYIE